MLENTHDITIGNKRKRNTKEVEYTPEEIKLFEDYYENARLR